MKITTFEDIEGWQLGRELTRKIYEITKIGKFAKDYGLKDQIRRASGSVMHNIAEGFDAGTNPEFIRFLGYSQRSCSEIQSQLYVALDQDYFDNNTFNDLYDLASYAKSKVGAFIKYLKQNPR